MKLLENPRVKGLVERVQKSLPYALVQRFIECDLLTQAASLSFFALISLAPLLVLLLWLTASLYPEAQDALISQIGGLAGPQAEAVANTVIRNASDQPDIGSLAGLWSTLLLFVGATVVFARLQTTLNLIFHTSDKALGGLMAWLRKRVFSVGVVFSLGFLIIISTLAGTVVELAFRDIPVLVPLAGNAVMLLVYTCAFALMYHYLPDRRVHWKQAFLGGLITAVLFLVGRWAIALYLAQAAPGSAYGSAGALVLLLVWMYYAAMIFFGGAMITAVIDERWRAHVARRADKVDDPRRLPVVLPEDGGPSLASEPSPPRP
ncbi:YihY/virulence factor BrkB family protein [Luteimonas qiangzhengi]|uniref:YihY/virulence factor BrkB family protein n=1 Tax=Luteimonas sp. MJ146 TaxID=3129240 RepID=UPI0031BABEFF